MKLSDFRETFSSRPVPATQSDALILDGRTSRAGRFKRFKIVVSVLFLSLTRLGDPFDRWLCCLESPLIFIVAATPLFSPLLFLF